MKHLLAALLLVMLALGASQPVLAHAQFVSARPMANAVLDVVPQAAHLAFNEPVAVLALTLFGPDGGAMDLTGAAQDGAEIAIALPPDLGQGTHVLSWRVASMDGHPVAGSLLFSIGAAGGTAQAEPTAGAWLIPLLLWAARIVLFAGLFFGLGGAIFALIAEIPAQAKAPAARLVLAGLVAAPLSLGLHRADGLGLGPDALLTGAAWAGGFYSAHGTTILVLMAALVLALPVLAGRSRFAWPALALALVAPALSGHAAMAAPQALTRPALALHIGGIVLWAGALLPLWFWLGRGGDAADRALARFSRAMPPIIGAILLSGLALAIVQLGAPGPAWLAPYGLILAAKLGLVLALSGLAAWNRFGLTAPVLAGNALARRQLRKSVLAEMVLVLAILGLVSAWRFTPPARAIAEAEAAAQALALPVLAHAMDERIMADITILPGRAGPANISIALTDLAGMPIEAMSVGLTLSAPERGIEAFTVPAMPDGGGLWQVRDQILPLPGRWDLVLDIRIDRFTLSRIGTEIELK